MNSTLARLASLPRNYVPGNAIDITKYASLDRTGTTNCVAAINNVINNVKPGSDIFFPAGSYLLSATSGTELLLLTQMVSLYFAQGAVLKIAAAVPDTCDVLRIQVANLVDFVLRGMHVSAVSGVPARHGINLDLSIDASYYCAHSIFAGMNINHLGGRSFILSNPTNADGFFTSTIYDNYFWDGMSLLRLGDSMLIEKNTFPADADGNSKTALDISMVAGAASLGIHRNNCTMKGGFLRITSGQQVWVTENQIEQTYANSMSESALIALVGSVNYVELAKNNLNGHAGNCDHNILVDNADSVTIHMNDFGGSSGNVDEINITANATNTLLGWRNTNDDCRVTDAGVYTRKIAHTDLSGGSGGNSLSSGLIINYELGEASGNAIESVNGLTGTQSGTVGSNVATYGNARHIGIGNYFSHGNDSHFILGVAAFAFHVRAKITSISGSQTYAMILTKDFGSAPEYQLMYYKPDGVFTFLLFNSGATVGVVNSSAVIVEGAEYDIYVDWDGTTLRIRVNDVTEDTVAYSSGGHTDTGNFFIGTSDNVSGGLIADVYKLRVWNRQLTSGEITQLHNGTDPA